MAKNNNKLRFIEGAVAGLALGVAASMFLSSKKGKEIKEDIADIAADFYKSVSPKIKRIKKYFSSERSRIRLWDLAPRLKFCIG